MLSARKINVVWCVKLDCLSGVVISVVTKKQVFAKLKKVIDPELNINIVDLGLVYGVEIEDKKEGNWRVLIDMTLTSPGCPLIGVIHKMVKDYVSELDGVVDEDVVINLTFDPPWAMDMMSEEAQAELGFI